MEEKPLELRMYFLVPYNISPIQQAIQAGHAALRYTKNFGTSELFKDFIDNHETWVILNGGTTNDQRDLDGIVQGTLNQIGDELNKSGIDFSFFHEPDLNNALTALCFIADERVFNKKDYPDFVDYILDVKMYADAREQMPIENYKMFKAQTPAWCEEHFPEYYKEWVRSIGGVKNAFLRDLLKDKKLA